MKVGKVWIFLVVAVLVATDVSSRQVDSVRGGQELDQKLSNHSDGTPGNEVIPKRPTLYGPINRREFTGNWNISLKNKDQSDSPNKIRLNSNTLLQEKSQDISKKALKKSFSKVMFDNVKLSVPIRRNALHTKFMQGMAVGSLKPTQFGRYMVQDTAYLANAVKMYTDAAQKMEEQGEPDFAIFYRGQASKYDDYYKGFLKTWYLESAEAVHLGPAVQAYMGYQQVVVKQHPRYLPVAMLPCTMLWPWMASSLIETVDEQNPYYADWFVQNIRQPGTQSSTEKFVDQNEAKFDESIALEIFCEGMMNELNFFREACDEAPLKLSDICPVAG